MLKIPFTHAEVLLQLGKKCKVARIAQTMRQRDLAARSGVSIATLRRFEAAGETSVKNLVKILFALGLEHRLLDVFEPPHGTPKSIKEIQAMDSARTKQRVRK